MTRLGEILKVLGDNFFHISNPNVELDFWSLAKNGTFYVELLWIHFGQFLEKIGLLFIPSSGHTVTLTHTRQKSIR